MQAAVGYRQRNDGFSLSLNNELRDLESHTRSIPIRALLLRHFEAPVGKVLVGEGRIDSFRHYATSKKEKGRRLFAVAQVGRVGIFLFAAGMNLLQDCLQLFGNGQSKVCRIFQ